MIRAGFILSHPQLTLRQHVAATAKRCPDRHVIVRA
jgi:hypothetical protein